MESLNNHAKKSAGLESLEMFLESVEGKLREFGDKVEAAADHAQVKAHLGLMEAESTWGKKREEILGVVARLRAAQTKQKAVLDQGRLQLHLGKEEAREAVAKLRERLEATEHLISELSDAANADAKAALCRLKDAYGAIKGKLLH